MSESFMVKIEAIHARGHRALREVTMQVGHGLHHEARPTRCDIGHRI